MVKCLELRNFLLNYFNLGWLLYDFRSERRHTIFNKGFNRKGVIAEDKTTRKLGFHALAACYAALKDRT